MAISIKNLTKSTIKGGLKNAVKAAIVSKRTVDKTVHNIKSIKKEDVLVTSAFLVLKSKLAIDSVKSSINSKINSVKSELNAIVEEAKRELDQ